MGKLRFPTALLAAAALAACAPPAAQNSLELAATSKAWDTAFNQGDSDALAAMYTEDCRVLPPNGELAQGRDAVKAIFGEMIASGVKTRIETLEAVVAGDIGYKVGRYSVETPEGAELERGKFVELWKRVDGEWLISDDIWNSDLAAAPAQTLTITHEVQDAARWLAAWQGPTSRHELFAKHGAPKVRVLRSPDNPNLTGLLIEVADMNAFQAFMASPEATAAKAEDGVKDPTLRVFAEVQ